MKKLMILSALLITFVFINANEAKAQNSKRIEFGKGKSSATVSGNTGKYGVTYVVRAKSGQKLILNLTPTSRVGIKVENDAAKGEMVLLREERGGSYEVGLEESGDYTIFIGSTTGKPIPFTLTVKITRMTDI